MEKKITKKEMFTLIREAVADNANMVKFIDHEIELLNKKSASKKPTKTQVENEALKDAILNVLNAENGMTASEVLKANTDFDGLSNQKVSALLNALVKSGDVVKVTDKKKSLFKLA